MGAEYLEVWGSAGAELVTVEGKRVTFGRGPGNDVVLDDPTVSKIHAVLERYGGGWAIRDLGSTNGTFVNGERLTGERALSRGDELLLGDCRLVLRAEGDALEETAAADAAPELTRRERDVLRALCRPLARPSTFARPATVKEIAAELVVSEGAVKAHLVRLYDKFEIFEANEGRRVRLANEAVQRRAVTLSELRGEG